MSFQWTATLPRGRVLGTALALAGGAVLASCTAAGPGRETVADRPCPDRPPAVYAALDVSDTARDNALVAERLAGLDGVLTDTAACGGSARVVAFTASAAATSLLYDGDLAPEGATRRAQLRRVPAVVDRAMTTVRASLPPATRRLPAGGTDVLAQLGLAAEYFSTAGPDRPHRAVIWTDGLASAPVDLNTASLDAARGRALADSAPIAIRLAGADVTLAGIGRPAGAVPPTTFVDGLKAFYVRACERASAASCTVVTDAGAVQAPAAPAPAVTSAVAR